MALITIINQMKQQGMNDDEIARNLQEQGYSPQEVANSITQAELKPAYPQQEGEQEEGMQPSMMPSPPQNQPFPIQQPITKELQEGYPQAEEAYPQQGGYEQYPQQQYSQYAPYQQQQGYEEYLPSTSDTMTEIAEEIIEEKLRKLNKEISSLSEIKIDLDAKMSNLNSRIKRIESIIDKLNEAILKKISMYGQDLEDIKSELTATQESFSKIINPLVDKTRKQERKPESREEKLAQKKEHKKSGMEHYLSR